MNERSTILKICPACCQPIFVITLALRQDRKSQRVWYGFTRSASEIFQIGPVREIPPAEQQFIRRLEGRADSRNRCRQRHGEIVPPLTETWDGMTRSEILGETLQAPGIVSVAIARVQPNRARFQTRFDVSA